MMEDHFAAARRNMVESQLKKGGIHDPRVLEAFLTVPRHAFVLPGDEARAHEDHPLDIGEGQTISQPYMVAIMTQELALRGRERVLEIGTGSGYETAILASILPQGKVYTIERLPGVLERARTILSDVGAQVEYRLGDGTLGWPDQAPFDRIIVAAASPFIPPSLLNQLGPNGIMVVPVGIERHQELLTITKDESGHLIVKKGCECLFVKLVGIEGWREKQ